MFSFGLIFATLAIAKANSSYCSNFLEHMKQIDSMREFINHIQSLPAAQRNALNNQLEQKCNDLQEEVNGYSESELTEIKR